MLLEITVPHSSDKRPHCFGGAKDAAKANVAHIKREARLFKYAFPAPIKVCSQELTRIETLKCRDAVGQGCMGSEARPPSTTHLYGAWKGAENGGGSY